MILIFEILRFYTFLTTKQFKHFGEFEPILSVPMFQCILIFKIALSTNYELSC